VFDTPDSGAGRSYAGNIRLKSNVAMNIAVSIGRQGASEYEGTSQRITLAPGMAQTVRLRVDFAKKHHALKLQAEVLTLDGDGTAELTIDSVYAHETLTSIGRRMTASDLNMSVANRLFRQGDYSTAMGIYLLLHQQRPLKMYPDNALMAARKLGLGSVRSAQELLQLAT
jgi:hypothetical protein